MTVGLAFLERAAADTGFQPAVLEKVIRLGDMARDIARHPLLGNSLLLKGGTVINLCLASPPQRLSVDLDYNYVGQLEREAMVAARPGIEAALIDLAQRGGYRVQQSADTFAGRKMHLGYRSALGHEDRLEIDVNYLFRIPLVDPVEMEVWQPGSLDRPRVRCVGAVEVWAGKILALLARMMPRDAWDVGRQPLLDPSVTATPGFRSHFLALAATLDHPLPRYGRIRFQKRITDRMVREQLAPMLGQVPVPAATELVDKAWTVLAPFLDLQERERRFFEAVQRGELRLGMLFPEEPEVAERLAGHPALLWKIVNVRRHLGLSPEA